MKIIGVTGTNGKTTCVHLISHLTKDYLKNCASFGTLGIKHYINNHCFETKTTLTTLGNKDLHDNLTKVNEKNCKLVAMEVSSHGLVQKRVAGVNFAAAVFTNLSHDHLDYHKTIEHYFHAKTNLFTDYLLSNNSTDNPTKIKYAIINLDDQYGIELIKLLQNLPSTYKHRLKIIGFSINSNNAIISNLNIAALTCNNIIFTNSGIEAYIDTPWGKDKLHSPLFGLHNLSNLLASIATCMSLFNDNYTNNISLSELLQKCSTLTAPTGRLQASKIATQVIIDYAHTPDGLRKALQALKQHYSDKKICCVFGCGGNRDPAKRPKMLEIAEQYSDAIIITQDNSRLEEPQQIIADILAYKTTKLTPMIEMDRKEAIYKAIKDYYHQKGYIVLIAGKGHETEQIIGNQSYYFCDIEVAEEALKHVKQHII